MDEAMTPEELEMYEDIMTDMDYNYSMEVNGVPMDSMDGAAVAAIGGAFLVFFVLVFAVTIVMVAAMWKLFKKANQPGWAAIIPIYNVIVMLQMVRKPLWWVILLFIPIVNVIVIIMLWHEISKAFGKDIGFTLGLIFFGIIFLPILAFGSSKYQYGTGSNQPPQVPPQNPNPNPNPGPDLMSMD